MKKIPTLFKRVFEGHKIVGITEDLTSEDLKPVLEDGIPTVKWDGSCCAIINGQFYKRYDAKKGKPVPEGAIKCQEEPDPITGHMPCWVEVDPDNKADKWFMEAYVNTLDGYLKLPDGTYEALGPHFRGNPYNFEKDILKKHGVDEIKWYDTPLNSFNNIGYFLRFSEIEGIVFWYDGEPRCKIKRSDFGYSWPVKKQS